MEEMRKENPVEMWVSLEFLSWGGYVQSSSIGNEKAIKDQYAIWKHAENLLASEDQNNFTSCIMQLGRVINKREKLLNEYYNFRRMPTMKKYNLMKLWRK